MSIKNPEGRLSLFCERAQELRESIFIQEGGNIGVTLKWDKAEGLRIIEKKINSTNLKAYLVTFRQFFLKKEPIFIFAIYNLCLRHITNDRYREYLARSRDILKKSLRYRGVPIIYNGVEKSAQHIMDLMINGVLFHSSDEDKMKEVQALLPHEKAFYRFNFLNVILDAAKQIIYVESIIRASIAEGSIHGR
jgi:hypothetical protein